MTADGLAHPVMRSPGRADGLAKHWEAMPALAGVATLGALRPGAQALAVVNASDGPRPLVAIQRFGQGRVAVFAGEASWRWRMHMPSADRTHELFWRQAARWLSASTPDRVSIASVPSLVPGSVAAIAVAVRTEEFAPVGDAGVRLRVTKPDGSIEDVAAALTDSQSGRYSGEVLFDDPGIYRVGAVAQRGEARMTAADRWILVGGTDLEMADPRLNDDVLRRIAIATGGDYLRLDDAAGLPSLLAASAQSAPPQLQELWHNVWIFVGLMVLLASEWVLRRRWGLR